MSQPDYSNKHEKATALIAVKGHPLYTFTQENKALSDLIEKVRVSGKIEAIRGISVHYAKKGDLLYPLLKAKYDIAGPSDLMWTDDDEIRDEISALAKETERGEDWKNRLNTVLDKAEQMIVKDQKVLFPICAVNFTSDEWKGIYLDSKAYDTCFGVENEIWTEAEEYAKPYTHSGEVHMPGGHLTVEQVAALFNYYPRECTVSAVPYLRRRAFPMRVWYTVWIPTR